MPQDGRHVGPSSAVPFVRPCRLLRFLEEQARHEAFSFERSSDCAFARARRKLEVVLHRSSWMGIGAGARRNARETVCAQRESLCATRSPFESQCGAISVALGVSGLAMFL